ncbi:MAG: ribosomal RNA small subunit methyltransferase A [Spirochaetaceae bacterium]|nr:MAG: ribosomal RNA small subunit methyltransferase A [Spirochaetaceae bacterium]
MLNYNSPAEIRRVLDALGLRLQKRWGQNFLINRGARRAIVSLVEPEERDTVWEIGPGLGTLTVLLLPEIRFLQVFEIDRGLIRFLNETFGDHKNFRIVAGDVMKTWKSCLDKQGPPDKIVGNLPYSSASALIGALAENRVAAKRMVFTVQRELAQRMTAEPGNKNYSSFTVLCQVAYRISERMKLKPGSFFPPPEVHSSVVVLQPNTEVIPDWSFFLRCTRALFRSRRKTMRNNLLAAGFTDSARLDRLFGELGIDPGVRSERLTPQELLRFSQRLKLDSEDL